MSALRKSFIRAVAVLVLWAALVEYKFMQHNMSALGLLGATVSIPSATSSSSNKNPVSFNKQQQQDDIDTFHKAAWARLREIDRMHQWMFWRTSAQFRILFKMWDDPKMMSDSTDEMWQDPKVDTVRSWGLADAITKFHKFGNASKDHVLITRLYENYGAASDGVPERSVLAHYSRLSLFESWKPYTVDDIMDYLNNDHVKAVFVTSHQFTDHPKMHSIPIGTQEKGTIEQAFLNTSNVPPPKSQLLMLNIGVKTNLYRQHLAPAIIQNFNGTIQNTYGQYSDKRKFFEEIMSSKFVLCPSGLGWDTYRAWEVLSLGSFPVIETFNRTDGYFRAFDDLPVLFVDNMMTDVTPGLLERAYPELASTKRRYKYEKLTMTYWYEFVNSFRPSHQTPPPPQAKIAA